MERCHWVMRHHHERVHSEAWLNILRIELELTRGQHSRYIEYFFLRDLFLFFFGFSLSFIRSIADLLFLCLLAFILFLARLLFSYSFGHLSNTFLFSCLLFLGSGEFLLLDSIYFILFYFGLFLLLFCLRAIWLAAVEWLVFVVIVVLDVRLYKGGYYRVTYLSEVHALEVEPFRALITHYHLGIACLIAYTIQLHRSLSLFLTCIFILLWFSLLRTFFRWGVCGF